MSYRIREKTFYSLFYFPEIKFRRWLRHNPHGGARTLVLMGPHEWRTDRRSPLKFNPVSCEEYLLSAWVSPGVHSGVMKFPQLMFQSGTVTCINGKSGKSGSSFIDWFPSPPGVGPVGEGCTPSQSAVSVVCGLSRSWRESSRSRWGICMRNIL